MLTASASAAISPSGDTKEALRKKAMERREATLREMGLVRMASPCGGDDRIVAAASPHSMQGLDDDDEEVVACMVRAWAWVMGVGTPESEARRRRPTS